MAYGFLFQKQINNWINIEKLNVDLSTIRGFSLNWFCTSLVMDHVLQGITFVCVIAFLHLFIYIYFKGICFVVLISRFANI